MTIFCLQRNTIYNVFNYKTTPVQTMGTVIQALSLSVVHQHYNHHLSNWLGRRLVRNKLKFDSIFMSGRIFNWLTMDRDQHGFSGFGRIHPSIHPAQLLRWIIYCSPLVAHSCIPPCDEAASPDQTRPVQTGIRRTFTPLIYFVRNPLTKERATVGSTEVTEEAVTGNWSVFLLVGQSVSGLYLSVPRSFCVSIHLWLGGVGWAQTQVITPIGNSTTTDGPSNG